MNTKLTILFSILAAFCAASVIKRKEDQGQSSRVDLKCYGKILNKFFLSTNLDEAYSPVAPDELTKDICPTLDLNCCKSDAIKAQFEVFNATYIQLREYFFLHSNITTNLRKHKVKPLKTEYTEPKCTDEDSYRFYDGSEHVGDSPTGETDPQKLISMFLYEMDQSLANHRTLNYTLSKYYSGFICGICHPKASTQFSQTHSQKQLDDDHIAFRYSLESFQAHQKVFLEILEYWRSLGRAYEILKQLPAKPDFTTDVRFMHPKEIQCAITKIKPCLELKTVAEIFANGKKCFIGLEAGILLDFRAGNFETVRTIYRDINEYFFLHFNDLAMFPRRAEALPIKIQFATQNIDTEISWDNVEPDLHDGGFNVLEHQYREKKWFLGALRVGVSLLAAVIAALAF